MRMNSPRSGWPFSVSQSAYARRITSSSGFCRIAARNFGSSSVRAIISLLQSARLGNSALPDVILRIGVRREEAIEFLGQLFPFRVRPGLSIEIETFLRIPGHVVQLIRPRRETGGVFPAIRTDRPAGLHLVAHHI